MQLFEETQNKFEALSGTLVAAKASSLIRLRALNVLFGSVETRRHRIRRHAADAGAPQQRRAQAAQRFDSRQRAAQGVSGTSALHTALVLVNSRTTGRSKRALALRALAPSLPASTRSATRELLTSSRLIRPVSLPSSCCPVFMRAGAARQCT
jgi:hypothetical protein